MMENYLVPLRWEMAGMVDATDAQEYLNFGGMDSIRNAISMSDEEILKRLNDANLLGRGGAAYPAGKKWSQLYGIPGETKYIVCNADEGEPGTFKDRELLAHQPFHIIEGMMIAAWLFKAKQGYIYVRGEYRKLQLVFSRAVQNTRAAGYLGKDLFGIPGFDFDISVVSGGGAYVCGENSTLLNSIEGKAGRPRIKPPHLAEVGLYGKPTLVNNVETYAKVMQLFRDENGLHELLEEGAPGDGGSKMISISGMSRNRGVFEVKATTPIRVLLEDPAFGGGTASGRPIKFFHMGGQSGPIGFPEQMDTPYDYYSLKDENLSTGSGALVVLDDSVCLVDYCRRVINFLAHESCGKCTPCRIGMTRLLELLTKFTDGTAEEGDIERLEYMALRIHELSFCGLGQAANRALLSAIRNRREEFQAHIEGRCPAGSCSFSREVRK